MGKRTLKISVELLIDILKGLRDGPPRYFTVTKDPVPADAKMVSCRTSKYWPNMVEVVLESATFEGDEGEIRPNCAVVEAR